MSAPRLGLHVPLREKQAVDPKTGFWTAPWLGLLQILGLTYGAWNDVDFVAGHFAGGGAQTWTVASADQVTFAYGLMGKRLEVVFTIRTSSVGGVADPSLRIAIPARDANATAYTAARATSVPVWITDNGTRAIGVATVAAGGSVITIQKVDGSNWAGSVNTTGVEGVIAFEVS